MLEIKYNLSKHFCIPVLDNNQRTMMLSSNDNTSRNIIEEILTKVYKDNQIIFKVSGYPETVSEIVEIMKNDNLQFYEGEVKRFSIKKCPAFHTIITTKEDLTNALNSWSRVIYERRYLYIVKNDKTNILKEILNENIYKENEENIYNMIWPCVDCIIENAPDAENDDTFILIFKKDKLLKIKEVINKIMN